MFRMVWEILLQNVWNVIVITLVLYLICVIHGRDYAYVKKALLDCIATHAVMGFIVFQIKDVLVSDSIR